MARSVNNDHSSRSHSDLPPSSADKWLECWNWLYTNGQHIERFGEPPTSDAALEGTEAHEVLETLLRGSDIVAPEFRLPKTKVGRAKRGEAYDHEHYSDLEEVLDYITSRPGKLYPEARLDYGRRWGYANLTGTVDVCLVEEDRITILDLKFGRMVVEVDKDGIPNPQLMCYLLGAIEEHGERPNYEIGILQPRAYHKLGPIRTRAVTPAEVLIFDFDAERAIQANYAGTHECTPGDHCRKFCNALPSCGAVRKLALKLMAEAPLE